MVVYVDKVKQCMGETPVSWLGTQTYIVIPITVESDVLPIMFGGVDRGGVSTSADDVEPNVIVRPMRNAGVPARFLSRIYAAWDDAQSHVCKTIYGECVNNNEFCLFRFSDMKKTAKKTEFEYKCFPCRKQDDKARPYTRSYDFILHLCEYAKIS